MKGFSILLLGLQASLIAAHIVPAAANNQLERRQFFQSRNFWDWKFWVPRWTSPTTASNTPAAGGVTTPIASISTTSTATTSISPIAKIVTPSSLPSSSSTEIYISPSVSSTPASSSISSAASSIPENSAIIPEDSALTAEDSLVTAAAVDSGTVKSTILIIARDAQSAEQVSSGFNGYGIPFQTLIVPQGGVALPVLNSSSSVGNFGGIVALSGLSYEYSGGEWRSAITDDQWNQLYAYQKAFGVRMTQIDVYPQAAFGTSVVGTCCENGVEQLISFSNTSAFTQAGLKTGAGMTTIGLYHYLVEITDPSTTWEIAQYAPSSSYGRSTAAVINNFSGREQMVFFISWATEWSSTSNYLQHAYITWLTRGLYAGYRRVNLNAQIDDMMLGTPIYNDPSSRSYRVTPADMSTIRDWVPTINAKMNPGSFFKPEVGYNGDGNLIEVDPSSSKPECEPHPIFTGYNPTEPEFKKPLGTGVDLWPADAPTKFIYSSECLDQDPLSVWFQNPTNRDSLLHISHTFTHEHLNNATYNDVYREINFNQDWLSQVGIAAGDFSPKGLIPPAITGLHNGDALQAMWDLGLRNAVGDNARPVLMNKQNNMWPYITNTATDGFNGFTIVPRWPLSIYWNCDTPTCTTQEWINTSGGSGDFSNLMLKEKNDMTRYYFGLRHDGVMFHQINLRNQGMTAITTADGTQVYSLYQAWVELIVQEFTRLCNWPMISLKQDDLADSFTDRMARDQCNYGMTWTKSGGKITGVTVTANGNTCSAAIPITVPGSVVDTKGFRTEKVGNDPLTIWVKLSGSPVTLALSTPV